MSLHCVACVVCHVQLFSVFVVLAVNLFRLKRSFWENLKIQNIYCHSKIEWVKYFLAHVACVRMHLHKNGQKTEFSPTYCWVPVRTCLLLYYSINHQKKYTYRPVGEECRSLTPSSAQLLVSIDRVGGLVITERYISFHEKIKVSVYFFRSPLPPLEDQTNRFWRWRKKILLELRLRRRLPRKKNLNSTKVVSEKVENEERKRVAIADAIAVAAGKDVRENRLERRADGNAKKGAEDTALRPKTVILPVPIRRHQTTVTTHP